MYELSLAAQNVADSERLDESTLVDAARDALQAPGDSFWSDDEMWVTHTLMFATPDIELTDDYLYEYSNYRVVLAELEAAYPNDVEAATFGHWTYSRFVCIKIRVLDDAGQITGAFAKAFAITEQVADYPIYDEQDYMELEMECQEAEVKRWAQDAGVDADWVWEAVHDDVIYVEGVGSGFEIFANVTNWRESWDERQALLVKLITENHERNTVNVLEGV